MYFTRFATVALALPVTAIPFRPRPFNNSTCTPETIETRVEWANMEEADQIAYTSAVKCLMELPGQTGLDGTVTRFDDMNAMHQVQATTIHIVAQFLPFHRLYIKVYMDLLREECGYEGPTPWWDETRDAGNFISSPLLDPVTGFGGDGTGEDGCVTDGPFANTELHIGPGQTVTDHCLSRKVEDAFNSTLGNETYVQEGMELTNYFDYWSVTGLTTHGAGHSGIGGVMEDIDASPGDPLFYLHHAFVDRLWWNWQTAKPGRVFELGGPSTQGGDDETTLDYVMTTYDIRPNVTVGDVMDIQGGFLCYEYDY